MKNRSLLSYASTRAKLFYLLAIPLLFAACSEDKFEGKITYDTEFQTGLGKKLGIIDDLIGTTTNSTIDLYIKEGKVMMITEANNKFFGTFRGNFTKVIWDLDNQLAYTVNDKDKTYMEESLLDSDVEGFSFKGMKAQIDSSLSGLGTPTGQMTIAQYPCETYEIDGSWMSGKVAVNKELLKSMSGTLSKIEGMQDFDYENAGFPLYFENKLGGMIGMTTTASKIEKKELDDGIFNLDGYRKIDTFEFYESYIDGLPLEELGLSEGVDMLKGKADTALSGITEGIGAMVDSAMMNIQDIDVDGFMDDIFGSGDKEEK